MAFRRPFSFEMWKSINEGIQKYEEKLKKLRVCRLRALQKKESLIRKGHLDLHEVEEVIDNVERLISEVSEKRDTYKAIQERRHELYIELYELAYRLLEERRRPQPVIHRILRQNAIQQLFAEKIDERTRVVVRHLAFYCLKKNNYISRNPYQCFYSLLKEFWGPITGLGEAVLIMGYNNRSGFRNYIRNHFPQTSILFPQFSQFMITSLTDIFREFYIHEAPHLSFLIVAAFTMEVMYYIRECKVVLKRQLIKIAFLTLCSVLSSKGFINICGMDKLEWYGTAVSEGHTLAPPFDHLRTPLHQSMHPVVLPYDYLDENPSTSYRSPEMQTSRSMVRLEALPIGTEACSIVEVLDSSPEETCEKNPKSEEETREEIPESEEETGVKNPRSEEETREKNPEREEERRENLEREEPQRCFPKLQFLCFKKILGD